MRAITVKEKLPKFLIVNGNPEKQSHNKHLLKPFIKGEVVKIAPFDEQVPSKFKIAALKYVQPMSVENFRKRYVKVIRKDDKGEWGLVYTESWQSFDLLTKSKNV